MLRRPPRSTLFPSRRSSDLQCGRKVPRLSTKSILCGASFRTTGLWRSEEHTSELQSHVNLVCRLLLEKKNAPGLAPGQNDQFVLNIDLAPTIADWAGVSVPS